MALCSVSKSTSLIVHLWILRRFIKCLHNLYWGLPWPILTGPYPPQSMFTFRYTSHSNFPRLRQHIYMKYGSQEAALPNNHTTTEGFVL